GTIDRKTNQWVVTVHIADVGAFVKPGGALDAEARRRATSVYLPQKVIPMFPEVISNGLASLQEGKLRYVKTVRMEFTPGLQKGHVEFFNGAIKNRKRSTYDEVQQILDALSGADNPTPPAPPSLRGKGGAEQGAAPPEGSSDSPSPLGGGGRGEGSSPDILAMLRRMRDL